MGGVPSCLLFHILAFMIASAPVLASSHLKILVLCTACTSLLLLLRSGSFFFAGGREPTNLGFESLGTPRCWCDSGVESVFHFPLASIRSSRASRHFVYFQTNKVQHVDVHTRLGHLQWQPVKNILHSSVDKGD